MKGYTTTETSTEHAPEVLEDKVVVFFDDGEEKWKIERTTVTRRTIETTARHESSTGWATYTEAARVAEDHSRPVYVPSDDRHRAETELAEAAEAAAQKTANDTARRAKAASESLTKKS